MSIINTLREAFGMTPLEVKPRLKYYNYVLKFVQDRKDGTGQDTLATLQVYLIRDAWGHRHVLVTGEVPEKGCTLYDHSSWFDDIEEWYLTGKVTTSILHPKQTITVTNPHKVERIMKQVRAYHAEYFSKYLLKDRFWEGDDEVEQSWLS